MAATPTLLAPHRTFIKDDLPTFGYPTVPTLSLLSGFLDNNSALDYKSDISCPLVKI